MKQVKVSLTAEAIATKKAQLQANIEALSGKPEFQAIVDGMQADLNELIGHEAKLAGVDKVAEFKKLFGEYALELDEPQKAFVGEGITIKLLPDGTLELVKKSGGNFGGTKKPTPYVEFYFNGKSFKSASDCINGEGGILSYLKDNGTDIKVSEGNSMRREVVKLNGEYELGVEVKDRETQARYLLAESPHEEEATEETETETAE